jgi:hypothetical protein
MNTRTVKRVLWALAVSAMIVSVAAADDPAPAFMPSKEMRAQMATIHEQMAACLRSDKAFADCRSDMMKSCHQLMGGQGCPMMRDGMHHQMKQTSPSTPAPKT